RGWHHRYGLAGGAGAGGLGGLYARRGVAMARRAGAQAKGGESVLRHDRRRDRLGHDLQRAACRSDQGAVLDRRAERRGRGADHGHDHADGRTATGDGALRPAALARGHGLDRHGGDVRRRCRSYRYLVNSLPIGERTMKNYLRGLTLAGLGLALLGLPMMVGPACAAPDSTTLSLPGEGVTFLPIYAAQDAHFFEKEGLAVKTVHLPGVGTTNAVISGAVDFGISNGVSLTRAAAHGQNMLAIASMSDRPGWTLVMRKDVVDASGINLKAPLKERMQILKGHSFAIDTV